MEELFDKPKGLPLPPLQRWLRRMIFFIPLRVTLVLVVLGSLGVHELTWALHDQPNKVTKPELFTMDEHNALDIVGEQGATVWVNSSCPFQLVAESGVAPATLRHAPPMLRRYRTSAEPSTYYEVQREFDPGLVQIEYMTQEPYACDSHWSISAAWPTELYTVRTLGHISRKAATGDGFMIVIAACLLCVIGLVIDTELEHRFNRKAPAP